MDGVNLHDMEITKSAVIGLDKRVVVLEERARQCESDMSSLVSDIKDLRKDIAVRDEYGRSMLMAIDATLTEHVKDEAKDRIKIMAGILTLIVSASVGFLAWATPILWSHITSARP